MTRDAQSILENVRRRNIRSRPFTWVSWKPALEPAYYEILMAAYPSLAQVIWRRPYQQNARYDIDACELLLRDDIDPVMKEFIKYHTSKSFWLEIVRLLGPRIRRQYPYLEETVGKNLEDFHVGVRNAKRDPEEPPVDIEMDAKPGYNTPVTRARTKVRGPHIDNPRELFAALMYCRFDDDTSKGGNLIIEKSLVSTTSYRWHGKSELYPKDCTCYAVQKYKKNEACFFINSLRAIHSVTEREPTRHPRRLMNFIAEVRHPLFLIPKKRITAP